MRAIEFETRIENGLIVLPNRYCNFNAKRSRIIVLVKDDDDVDLSLKKKERLLLAFRKVQELSPFKEITDAVEWQKHARDEWVSRIIG